MRKFKLSMAAAAASAFAFGVNAVGHDPKTIEEQRAAEAVGRFIRALFQKEG